MKWPTAHIGDVCEIVSGATPKTGKPEYHPVAVYKDGELKIWKENYVYRLPSGEIAMP